MNLSTIHLAQPPPWFASGRVNAALPLWERKKYSEEVKSFALILWGSVKRAKLGVLATPDETTLCLGTVPFRPYLLGSPSQMFVPRPTKVLRVCFTTWRFCVPGVASCHGCERCTRAHRVLASPRPYPGETSKCLVWIVRRSEAWIDFSTCYISFSHLMGSEDKLTIIIPNKKHKFNIFSNSR